jgi:putative aminopeptidase FrvX
MVQYLKKTASDEGIAYQMEVLSGGATDTAMLQRMGKQGAIAGAISLPIRNMHQVIELINKDDLSNSVELLKKAILKLDKFDWSHL